MCSCELLGFEPNARRNRCVSRRSCETCIRPPLKSHRDSYDDESDKVLRMLKVCEVVVRQSENDTRHLACYQQRLTDGRIRERNVLPSVKMVDRQKSNLPDKAQSTSFLFAGGPSHIKQPPLPFSAGTSQRLLASEVSARSSSSSHFVTGPCRFLPATDHQSQSGVSGSRTKTRRRSPLRKTRS